MADENSVGTLYLDFRVVDKIEAQIRVICRKASGTAEKSFEQVGEAASEAIARPLEQVGKALDQPVKEMEQKLDGLDDIVARATNRYQQRFSGLTMTAGAEEAKAPEAVEKEKPEAVKVPAIEKVSEKLDEAIPKAREIQELFQASNDPVELMEQKLGNVNSQLAEQERKLLSVRQAYDKAVESGGFESGEALKLDSQATAIQQKMISLQQTAMQTEAKINKALAPKTPGNPVEKPAEKIKKSLKQVGTAVSQASKKVSAFLSGISGPIGKLAGKIKDVFKQAEAAASRTSTRISALLSGMGKSFGKLGSSMKSALKSALSAGLDAFFKAFKSLMSSAMKQNKEFSASLNAVKGNLSAAFMPVIQSVMPMLNALMAGLAKVTQTIAVFMSSLFGKTYSQSVAAAKQLQKVEGSAKKTKKALSTMGIDELNIQQRQEDTGGGGGADTGIDYDALKLEEEPPAFKSWGEAFSSMLDGIIQNGLPKLKSAFSSFAGWLNGFSGKLYEAFTFPGVYEKIGQLGAGLAEALNGLVQQIDWATLGAALGAGINNAISFLVSFLYTFDWLALGASLAALFNNAIAEIDWENVGQLLWAKFKIAIETLAGFLLNLDMAQLAQSAGEIVTGFFDAMTETLQGIDWFALGEQVKEFLVNVDWAGVAESVFTAIGAAFGAAAEFLWGLLQDAWNAVVGWWHDVAYEDGEFTWEGLLDGISEGIKNIGNWIQEHIFQPFINGFKSVFGIHSPSTVMAEMGGYLIDGMKNGLLGLWDKVRTIFTGAVDKIKGVFSWETLKNIGTNMISGLFNGLSAIGQKIGDWGNSFINGVKDFFGIHSPSTEFESLGKYMMAGLGNGVEDNSNQVVSDFKIMFESVQELCSENVERMQAAFTTFADYLSGDFASAWAAVWDGCRRKTEQSVQAVIAKLDDLAARLAGIERNIVVTVTTVEKTAGEAPAKARSTISTARRPVPKLARGAVIPPNREFTAVLGDQKHGTNIETPLDTMIAAFKTANGELVPAIYQMAREIVEAVERNRVEISADSKGILRTVQKQANEYQRAHGVPAF